MRTRAGSQKLNVCAPLTSASTALAAPTICAPSTRCSCVMLRGLAQAPHTQIRPPSGREFLHAARSVGRTRWPARRRRSLASLPTRPRSSARRVASCPEVSATLPTSNDQRGSLDVILAARVVGSSRGPSDPSCAFSAFSITSSTWSSTGGRSDRSRCPVIRHHGRQVDLAARIVGHHAECLAGRKLGHGATATRPISRPQFAAPASRVTSAISPSGG